jgi:tartrate-resistant acid phosphatase type 5
VGPVPDLEVHFEPFLHLADVGAEEALIAWGGFYFRRGDSPYGEWRIVDDQELRDVAGDRTGTIGVSSEPYGEAVVEVERGGDTVATVETSDANHVWVRGLEPGTEYRYRVRVDGRPWAEEGLLDWDLERRTLSPSGRHYDNRFRTFPAEDSREPVAFAVLGDQGVGILASDENAYRQLGIGRALERACDLDRALLVLTTGDNVYLGPDTSGSGNEDDDWYASFYEPYRYVINRLPVFPTVGNHDAEDTESSDDRDQLADNLFLEQRFRPSVESGRASLDPGLFYRLRVGGQVEFICIDTSLAGEIGREHFFDDPAHADWVKQALAAGAEAPLWRIPFSHHPPYCAGPEHGATPGMVERLVPLFEEGGVRIVLSGHEHNFQHSRVGGIDYLVSGAAGKLRAEPPTEFEAAGTRAWAAAGHFLLIELDRERAIVHPVGGVGADGSLEEIEPRRPDGTRFSGPIVIDRGSQTP